jgi:hypothetical protein
LSSHNLQSEEIPGGGRGLSVASWPNGGRTAEAELMQNPVATTAKCIAERDRVKAAM